MNIAILGATSAIAHACARRWAAPGVRFCLVGRDAGRTQAVADDLIARSGASAAVIAHDFAGTASVAALMTAVEAAAGPLDRILIAQGVLPAQAGVEADPDAVAALYTINVGSVVAAMLAAAASMRERKRGEIIVLGSVAGDRGRPSNYLYGSTKAALAAACEGLRLSLAGTSVRLLLVKPGLVRSPMTAALPDSPLFAEPEAIAAAIDGGLRNRRDTIYAPWFWRPIMFIVRHAPARIVRRL
jgi:decaprenylphospho-beta-D-erythro-pentofuranosid-2-ulose 2-reductase